ncbi:MAG: DUF427 domain-containing protein [Desulfobacterales bacterium]|nr:DUF427 domain-containing protein [Desulfobacterales bacterium]
MWTYRGQKRPDFAVVPKTGQESVWDYPRPPKLVVDERRVEVRYGDQVVASSTQTYRVLETASPPSFYIPPQDVNRELIKAAPGASECEWKGVAQYWMLSVDPSRGIVGWRYPAPKPGFKEICDYFSFYPSVLHCTVSGDKVHAQPGQFYGGWITAEVVGPFKGGPGTAHW